MIALFESVYKTRMKIKESIAIVCPCERKADLPFSFLKNFFIVIFFWGGLSQVFICEQKLYTRVQLNKHISTGDSEVDGSESERGGFAGHPMCEFCRKPFYGDNELYLHMSTEHYTCHICQR